MRMWEVMELEKRESRIEGIAEGKAEGIAEGKAEGKAESIIEILEEIGSIPDFLKQKISEQKDINILNKWVKLLARAETIDEFIEKMNS